MVILLISTLRARLQASNQTQRPRMETVVPALFYLGAPRPCSKQMRALDTRENEDEKDIEDTLEGALERKTI
jgi:hypothetical protein